MSAKNFFFFLVLVTLMLVLLVSWMGWQGYKLQQVGVIIDTDKTEYKGGEVLRLRIENDFLENICFSSCYPYYLERKDGKWESYKYVECRRFDGNGHCIDAQDEKFFELTLPKVKKGIHRLSVPVCGGCASTEEFKEEKRFYSNEFLIK
jgi:hypothetical protein